MKSSPTPNSANASVTKASIVWREITAIGSRRALKRENAMHLLRGQGDEAKLGPKVEV